MVSKNYISFLSLVRQHLCSLRVLLVAFAFHVGLFNIGAGPVLARYYPRHRYCYLQPGPSPDPSRIPVVVFGWYRRAAQVLVPLDGRAPILASTRVISALCLTGLAFTSATLWFLFQFHQPNSTSSLPINESGYTTLFYGMKIPEMAAAIHIPVIGDAIMRTDINIILLLFCSYLYWLAAYAH